MELFLSIIIPVYKIESYIEACLDSVISDKLSSYEIILVIRDKCENDIGIKYCRKRSEIDHRIRIITQNGTGLSDARNSGLKSARGEYIVFFDGDDMIDTEPWLETIEELYERALNCKGPDIIVSDYTIIDEQGREIEKLCSIDNDGLYISNEYAKKFLGRRRNYWNIWQYIYRRKYLIQQNLFFKDGMFSEDIEFSTRVWLSIDNRDVGYVGRGYYRYRIGRQGSLATKVNIKHVEDLMASLDMSMKYCIKEKKSISNILIKKIQYQFILSWPMIYDVANGDKNQALRCIKNHRKLYCYNTNPLQFAIIKIVPIRIGAFALFLVRCIRRIKQGR